MPIEADQFQTKFHGLSRNPNIVCGYWCPDTFEMGSNPTETICGCVRQERDRDKRVAEKGVQLDNVPAKP
jgi:hypothetical protein